MLCAQQNCGVSSNVRNGQMLSAEKAAGSVVRCGSIVVRCDLKREKNRYVTRNSQCYYSHRSSTVALTNIALYSSYCLSSSTYAHPP